IVADDRAVRQRDRCRNLDFRRDHIPHKAPPTPIEAARWAALSGRQVVAAEGRTLLNLLPPAGDQRAKGMLPLIEAVPHRGLTPKFRARSALPPPVPPAPVQPAR